MLPRAAAVPSAHGLDSFVMPVRVDPYGLVFDAAHEQLYVADGDRGAVVRIGRTDHELVASVPAGGVAARHRIGGIAVTGDGTVYASRLGYGRAGAVLQLVHDGEPVLVPGLQAHVWRAGLAYGAAEHVLYATQFVARADGSYTGSILEVDLADHSSSLVAAGFAQPVGVARVGRDLVVADAGAQAIYAIQLEGGRAIAIHELASDVGRPTACCALGTTSALVATYDERTGRGAVRWVHLAGGERLLFEGAWEPRGIATDGERVFLALRTGLVVTALTEALDDDV